MKLHIPTWTITGQTTIETDVAQITGNKIDAIFTDPTLKTQIAHLANDLKEALSKPLTTNELKQAYALTVQLLSPLSAIHTFSESETDALMNMSHSSDIIINEAFKNKNAFALFLPKLGIKMTKRCKLLAVVGATFKANTQYRLCENTPLVHCEKDHISLWALTQNKKGAFEPAHINFTPNTCSLDLATTFNRLHHNLKNPEISLMVAFATIFGNSLNNQTDTK